MNQVETGSASHGIFVSSYSASDRIVLKLVDGWARSRETARKVRGHSAYFATCLPISAREYFGGITVDETAAGVSDGRDGPVEAEVNKSHATDSAPSIAAQRYYWNQRWLKQDAPNGWQQRRSDSVLAIARNLPLENPKILDLGCGTGFTTKALSELGEAQGVDLSPAAIKIARASYPDIYYRAGDVFEISFPDESFDLIVCQEVIPHVIDQLGLVEKIAASLKSGGYVIITAANKFVMKRLKGGDGGPVGSGPLDPVEHVKRWLSRRELVLLLEQQFRILHTTSVIPIGNKGILRLINSPKVNSAVGHVIRPQRLETLKGRLGWGYTIIVLGQKRL